MKSATPLSIAEAKLRRANNIFYTGSETLRDHYLRIKTAQDEVNYWKSRG